MSIFGDGLCGKNIDSNKGKEIMLLGPENNRPVHPDFDWDEDWDTDDEHQMEFLQAIEYDQGAVSSASSSSNPTIADQFVSMGFPERIVARAIKENDEDDSDAILNSIQTYLALENSPGEDPCSSSKPFYPYDDNCSDDFSEGDSANAVEKDTDLTISCLIEMGYDIDVAATAVKRCPGATVVELVDFISAADMAQVMCADFEVLPTKPQVKKRKSVEGNHRSRDRPLKRLETVPCKKLDKLPRNFLGFGVPGSPSPVSKRDISYFAAGPPYCYYENVANTPKGVWEQISSHLYDIKPEFVDSIHFSAAARKRGYIHNLPVENRRPLLPIPPKTIHEALPNTKLWWPSWDLRTKLSCLLTCIGSAQLTERIRQRVVSGNPSADDKEFVIKQCKKWNLVWVGKDRVAVLEPNEMEMLLGFPEGHTRGVSRTDRYKALGNSFQVDTVAYHLSVLKRMYPNGMNVLSLFSGIGGAEIALHRLGIPLKNVVSVEKSEVSRNILQGWWAETGQQGQLIHLEDVEMVDPPTIKQWIKDFNGFDLVIGGSPCNNLAGGNRRTRDGLEGEHSCLFYHYVRILDLVRSFMREW